MMSLYETYIDEALSRLDDVFAISSNKELESEIKREMKSLLEQVGVLMPAARDLKLEVDGTSTPKFATVRSPRDFKAELPVGKRVYEMDPPWCGHQFVVVSAVNDAWSHETYIFPSNEQFEFASISELPGSQRGTTSHVKVLNDIGYVILDPEVHY